MSQQDLQNAHDAEDQVLNSIDWLGKLDFSKTRLRSDCSWTPETLVKTSLLWAWDRQIGLTESYKNAGLALSQLEPNLSTPSVSYQAFGKSLIRHSQALLNPIVETLRKKITKARQNKLCGRPVLAGDGTKITLPRTISHFAQFASKKKQRQQRKQADQQLQNQKKSKPLDKKTQSVQLLLTVFYHVATGLPWDWRASGLDGNERGHLEQMLPNLPARAVLLLDAGFVGYDFWKRLNDLGHGFIVRIGSNVRLLKGLEYKRENRGTVYVWPTSRRKGRPLVLRLIEVYDEEKKCRMYLLTNILSQQELPRREAIRWYSRRWGVELTFRDFKQTFECGKLKSHTPEMALVECHWALMSFWILKAYAVLALKCPPEKVSMKKLLAAARQDIQASVVRARSLESFIERVKESRTDDYERDNKSSRNYPRKKTRRSPGQPKMTDATESEVEQAKEVGYDVPKRLTA